MRLRQLLLLGPLGIVLLCVSCVGRSLNPWFTEADSILENALVGKWTAHLEDETDTLTFSQDRGKTYQVEYLVESQDPKKAGRTTFEARLAKIEGVYYLDYLPSWPNVEERSPWMVPTHGLARLDLGENALKTRFLNYDRLKTAAKKGQLTGVKFIWEEETKEILLVSSTVELHRFLVVHAAEKDFFDEPSPAFVRQK